MPVSGSGAPYEMTSTEMAKWGQTDDPNEAMAIFPPDKVMGWPAKEYKGRERLLPRRQRSRCEHGTADGRDLSVEYNLYNDVIRTLTPTTARRP